jgi:hypothetical protein
MATASYGVIFAESGERVLALIEDAITHLRATR